MHIRMTGFIGTLTALATAAAVALSGAGSDQHAAQGTALVIDAGAAHQGRELVDPRLLDIDAEVRLPRDAREARTNVRYFDELGYRVVVVGARSGAAADATGVEAVHAADLPRALTLP
jgi:D-alanine-D-alanine ligase-like ATP-grasp enzyme